MVAAVCPLSGAREENSTDRRFVPPDSMIAELDKRASDYEQKAAKEEVPQAAELRQEAKLTGKWAAALRSGRCTS
jgi:hypothetical protein